MTFTMEEEIHRKTGEAIDVIKIIGPIKSGEEDVLVDAIELAIQAKHHLKLDVIQMPFANSGALGLFLGAYRKLDRIDKKLFIVSPSDDFENLLLVADLARLFNTMSKSQYTKEVLKYA